MKCLISVSESSEKVCFESIPIGRFFKLVGYSRPRLKIGTKSALEFGDTTIGFLTVDEHLTKEASYNLIEDPSFTVTIKA